jgi:HSP20 family protein
MNTLVRLNNRLEPAYTAFPDRIDDLFAGFFRPVLNEAQGRGLDGIKIDVTEDEKTYRVTASLPGVKKEDIHVAVDKNEVSISAEVKRESTTREGERVLHSERFYGKTSRVFSVAQEIDDAGVQAKYNDGVLSLTLPKKTQIAAKRVTVE